MDVFPLRFKSREVTVDFQMQANTVQKPKPRPAQGSQTGVYKVDSIKVEQF